MTLIAEKIAKGPSGRRFGADPGKPLGEHPSRRRRGQERPLRPLCHAGGVNATIPSDKTRRRSRSTRRSRCSTSAPPRAAASRSAAPRRPRRRRPLPRKPLPRPPIPTRQSPPRRRRRRRPPRSRNRKPQQGARAGRVRRQDIGGEARHCTQDACEKERGQGPGISEEKTRQWLSRPGRHRRLHPRESRQDRHARNRPRVRPEECRPRRTEAHPARARRRRPVAKRGRKISPARRPAADRGRRHHRPRHRRRIDRDPHRVGRPRKTAPRQRSAFTCRAVRSRARLPASATARCCASRSSTKATARSIAAASSRCIDHARTRVLGIFRKAPGGGGRLVPVDKKQAGRELNIARAGYRRRGGRRSRQRRSGAHARLRPRLRQGEGAARLAVERKGGQPDRDPRPRHSASVFARARCAKPRPRSPRR